MIVQDFLGLFYCGPLLRGNHILAHQVFNITIPILLQYDISLGNDAGKSFSVIFNEKSRNAIARLGAKEEGTFRKHTLSQHGYQRDSVYFSIIAEEWPAAKERLEAMLAR